MPRTTPNDIELKSEEVQEILGTPPGWMARWGTIFACLIFLLLAWGTYWIKYPDKIQDIKITITSSNPPKSLYSKEAGAIIEDLLVTNSSDIRKNEVLLVFASNDNARYNDVMSLYDEIISIKNTDVNTLARSIFSDDLFLGDQDLFEAYDNFKETLVKYQAAANPQATSRSEVQRMISEARGKIREKEQLKLKLARDLDIAHQKVKWHQTRLKEGNIPIEVLRTTEAEKNRLDRELQGVITEIRDDEYLVRALQDQLNQARQNNDLRMNRMGSELVSQFTYLKKTVEDWREKYLVISPMDGRVIYSAPNLHEKMIVDRISPVLIVIPPDSTETIGKINLAVDGSGKVQPKQKVIVRLKSYPFPEYGSLVGFVDWKGLAADQEKGEIPIRVSFPDGLITTSDVKIETTQELEGEATIITEDKRLIDWIVEGFRKQIM